MHTNRDQHLRLAVRKQNWIRIEQLRRTRAASAMLWRALLRCFMRDGGLTRAQGAWAQRTHLSLSRAAAVTQQSTRCRVSGRARQAFRDVQLARMHFRQHMAEGRLGGYRLGRT
jgi:ribosomal protein S14